MKEKGKTSYRKVGCLFCFWHLCRIMKLAFCILFFLTLLACSHSRYDQMYTKAKDSGIHNDSLFLSFEFGMSQDSFFNRCKEINASAGLFDSSGKLRVGRKIKINSEDFQMNFYPVFVENELAVMPFELHHVSYSQWNKQYYAGEILPGIVKYFSEEFALELEEFNHPEIGSAFLAFTGNRRLRLYRKTQKLVGGEFMDMSDKFNAE